MSDGSRWDIPTYLLARERASYYAEQDAGANGGPEYDRIYQEEYSYTMGDDLELIDWASNNTNWSDVERDAVRVQEPVAVDLAAEWTNADKHIVEK
jgi:hypothetical protein